MYLTDTSGIHSEYRHNNVINFIFPANNDREENFISVKCTDLHYSNFRNKLALRLNNVEKQIYMSGYDDNF